jgi:hypothetical protein
MGGMVARVLMNTVDPSYLGNRNDDWSFGMV